MMRALRTTAGTTPEQDWTAALREWSELAELPLLGRLNSSPRGLTEDEAALRLARHGENRAPVDRPVAGAVGTAVRSPFVGLLVGLGAVFAVLDDLHGMLTVLLIVSVSVGVRGWQGRRARRQFAALRRCADTTTTTVRRRASPTSPPATREVPGHDVVPGDVVLLAAGDLVAADLRLLDTRDLTVDQSSVSGEAVPVPKTPPAGGRRGPRRGLAENPALCLSGTTVVSGSGTAVVVATGRSTYAGLVGARSARQRPESGFDRGVRDVGRTMVRFMAVLVPVVLLVSGAVSGHWGRAAAFALAVAVGLTPEMLPAVVSANLARGAARLTRARVIVRRLDAVQDLGSVDVLCVDKTGTLTEDRVAYAHSVDSGGRSDHTAAEYARLALRFQADAPDRLDEALSARLPRALDEHREGTDLLAEALYRRVDDLGFTAQRRRATVVLRCDDHHLMITKGDPDVVMARCARHRVLGADRTLTEEDRRQVRDMVAAHARLGMRMLAVAAGTGPARRGRYREQDERDLSLLGLIGFVDPVAEGTGEALRALGAHGVTVKMLTGDHEQVAEAVWSQLGLPRPRVVLGHQVQALRPAGLRALVEEVDVFARLTPEHKTRIVAALRDGDHRVGFVGDGINDAPALRLADVGVAAASATEPAKRAADLVLARKSLAAIADGIVDGRATLGNTAKYVYITASSNFGNVLSVVLAGVALPFLPMLPIQLMLQNLLYDLAQLALPWDRVDPDYLRRPRGWNARGLVRFMLVFGALSSLFDVATFAALWWVFDLGSRPELFQSGWFVEGLCSQLLAVLVLRSAWPGRRGARPSRPVVLAALASAAVGLLLPLSPVAPALGLHPMPASYLAWLAAVLAGYGLLLGGVKHWCARAVRGWWA